MAKTGLHTLVLGAIALLGASFTYAAEPNSEPNTVPKNDPSVIYAHGDILTMEDDAPTYAEALVERNGKIEWIGSLEEARKTFPESELVNLEGATLVPGFIDPHSHFGMVINAVGQANVSPPPVGDVRSFSDIITTLKDYQSSHKIGEGEWIFAWGYDENQLAEKRHISKHELDQAFPNNPVYLQHTSGHLGIANSAALKLGGIDGDTPDPSGGKIIRFPDSSEPTGEVQEVAIYFFAGTAIKEFLPKKKALFPVAQNYYLQYGVTTAQDGMTDPLNMAFFQEMAAEGALILDLVTVHGYEAMKGNAYGFGQSRNNLKPQGIKLIVDGSPQGKTAFFSQPYLTDVPGCSKNCKGYPHMLPEVLDAQFLEAYKKGYQLFIHGNGDAAIDMIIRAHERANKTLGEAPDLDRRTVIIHSQFVREDQLQTFKRYNLMPSFFTNHAYFWGDVHTANLGTKRAGFLSPIKEAREIGLVYTNHSDETVTPVNPLFGIHTAVNRVSRSGQVIGADQRIDAFTALKAVTVNAAHQIFEEDIKGSLMPGKVADMVVLSKNPLTAEPDEIMDIQVLKTIKNGQVVYRQ